MDKSWSKSFKLFQNKLIIAGPCSLETQEQALATAECLRSNVGIYRAGLWKPRTSSGVFSGVGCKGLPWLKRVREDLGMPIATEVALPKHLEQCIKYDIDAVWLGARTVVSPFAVEELAQALRGSELPVFIKNPYSPDIKLWAGAVERMLRAGLKKIAIVHRGFYSRNQHFYRNPPDWGSVQLMHKEFPDLLVISDPSHIAGRLSGIEPLMLTALQTGSDGFMLEVHIDPQKALTDPMQQIPAASFNLLLERVFQSFEKQGTFNALERLRLEIDRLDEALLSVLQERFQILKSIGRYKAERQVPVLQGARWEHLLALRLRQADQMGLDPEFISQLFGMLHNFSIKAQE